jgi:hypothetical protein
MCWEPFARNSLSKPEEGARALSDRFTTASRHRLSANQAAALGPGRVKTCASEETLESFSLLPSSDSRRQNFWFSD